MTREEYQEKQENEKKIILQEYPFSMSIETSAYCNYRCTMCENPNMKRKKGFMQKHLFTKIVDEVCNKDIQRFYMSGYGEPLLNENICELVSYASNAGIKNTYLNTNGMLLNEKIAQGLIEGGLHCLIVSIDGFSREVYESIRVGGNRDIVYENVSRYLDILKQKGTGNQMVEVQLILMDQVIPEREKIISFWNSKGASIKLKTLIKWGDGKDLLPDNNDCVSFQRLACDFCNECQIMWNGDAAVCSCGDVEVTHVIGNAYDSTIKELWSKKKEVFGLHHINHTFEKLPLFCQACSNWMTTFAKHIKN